MVWPKLLRGNGNQYQLYFYMVPVKVRKFMDGRHPSCQSQFVYSKVFLLRLPSAMKKRNTI